MRHTFYDSTDYQEGQSKIVKTAWQKGSYRHLLAKTEKRKCKRENCNNVFEVKSFNPKQFCSQNCAAVFNNLKRGSLTEEWRKKISLSLIGKPNTSVKYRKGSILVPRLKKVCPTCGDDFLTERWKNKKYCSVACLIKDVGSRPTSPKAARARAGIRADISPSIYFFSRWEANFARIMNLLKIEWVFQPKTFDLKYQKYTPDFYLPRYGVYVEIKNFLSDYSLKRDKSFRKLYPKEKLILILKSNYLKLQDDFSKYIKNWEFS